MLAQGSVSSSWREVVRTGVSPLSGRRGHLLTSFQIKEQSQGVLALSGLPSLLLLFSQGLQVMAWYHPHSGQVFISLTPSGNPLTDTPKDEQPQ